MIVSIHQPAYLPWLGYFHKIALSDVFVILDTTQYEKNSYNNRNKIKTSNGSIWLTVPVLSKGKFKNNFLKDVKISDNHWQKKHWRTIEMCYSKSPYFDEFKDDIKFFYDQEWDNIINLTFSMLKYFVNLFEIDTKLILSSNLNDIEGLKSDLVLSICKNQNADLYISGSQGKDYLELNKFKNAGIEVYFQEYKHPEYNQKYGDFLPYMSILDVLFNEGKEETIKLISKGNITRKELEKQR
jgi:hypothetical protein